MRTFLLYLVSFAHDSIMIPVGLLIHALWGENLRLEGRAVCTDLRPESWPRNKDHWFCGAGWYANWGGSTLGHFIMYGLAPAGGTRVHEHVHVEQFEAAMLRSLIVGLLVLLVTGKLGLSYAIWALGYVLMVGSGTLIALIRGEDGYKGSVHEEHAYAVGDAYEDENTTE